MAASGYTPISLYYSSTAAATPTAGNLVNGELAINITDGKLFYKDNLGAVKVIAGTGGTGVVAGSNTQVQYNNNGVFGASSNFTFDGTNIGLAGGTANGVAYLNGSKVLTTGSALTFDGSNFYINGDGVGINSYQTRYQDNTTAAFGFLRKARGTLASPTAVGSGDGVGALVSQAYGGSNFRNIASIINYVDTYTSDTNISGLMTFNLNTGSTTTTEQMRLTSTGLGIGTSSPAVKLDVVGTTRSASSAFNPGTASWANSAFRAAGSYGGGLSFLDGSAGYGIWVQDSGGTLAIGQGSSTGGLTERMRIDSSGNVGIGTSTISSRLQVVGTNTTAGGTDTVARFLNGAGGTSTTYIRIGNLADNSSALGSVVEGLGNTAMVFNNNLGATSYERMRLDSSGNLGLGVTPSAWNSVFRVLDVSNSTSFYSQTNDPASGGIACNYYYNGSGSSIYKNTGYATNYYQTSGQHRWYTAPSGTAGNAITFTQAMTLDASGNLGIGTSSPAGTLSVYTKAGAWSGNNYGKGLLVYTSAVTNPSIGIFDVNNSNPLAITNNSGAFVISAMPAITDGTTGATERMRIDSSGNVGIGTSSVTSGAKLQVTGSDDTYVFVKSDGAGDYSLSLGSGGTPLIARGAGAPLAFGTVTNNSVITGWTEQMRIDSSGNVGIGSAAPRGCLDVVGTGSPAARNWAYVVGGNCGAQNPAASYYSGACFGTNFSNGYSETNLVWGQAIGSQQYFSISKWNGTSVTEQLRIDSSGNVGINKTSPTAKLHVGGAIYNDWSDFGSLLELNAFQTGNRYSLIDFHGDDTYTDYSLRIGRDNSGPNATSFYTHRGTGAMEFWGLEASTIRFGTSNAERMRIDSSGNLLVGTTSTASGVTGIAIQGNNRVFAPYTTATASAGTCMHGRRDTTGNFIQFTYNGWESIVGTVSTNGSSVAYNTSSDYRLKENVQPMQNALATVAQLNPVTYTWKADGSDGQGFIAHELQEHAPYAVSGEKDGEQMQGVDYGKITPLLTAALQEAMKKIEQLEARIATLEAKCLR